MDRQELEVLQARYLQARLERAHRWLGVTVVGWVLSVAVLVAGWVLSMAMLSAGLTLFGAVFALP